MRAEALRTVFEMARESTGCLHESDRLEVLKFRRRD